MELLRVSMELLTIFVSLTGFLISVHHSNFFAHGKDKFSKKMEKNFFWDAMVYMVTFFMGVGLFLDLKWLVEFNIIVRPLVLSFAVWASYRLFKHYKKIK